MENTPSIINPLTIMKLHLPKILLSAVVAVCCAQAAHAGTEKKTYTVGEGESAVTYNVTVYTGASNNNMRPDNVTLLEGTNMVGFELTSGGDQNYFYNGNFDCTRNVYISKGAATGDTKTGLIINNGYEGKVYTFSGNIYGDGDIYKTGNPGNGLTLKFTGNMSAYTGNTLIEGASGKNVLIYDGATTGTGTITSNGAIRFNSTTINSSSISTTGSLTIAGNTKLDSSLSLSAGNLYLDSYIKMGESNALTIAEGTRINITAIDLLDGKFGGTEKTDAKNIAGHVTGNGYFRNEQTKLFSNADNVTLGGGLNYTVAGVSLTGEHKTLTATYSTVYLVNNDATYSSDVMGSAKLLALKAATLTLESNLPESVTDGIYVREAGASINLSGASTTLGCSALTIKEGASVKIKGDGQFVLTTETFANGVSLGSAEEWTGTVVYNYTGNGKLNLSTHLAGLMNDKSALVLNGVKGYCSSDASHNALYGRTLGLKDNGNTKALEICDGNSAMSYSDTSATVLLADLEGDGTVIYTFVPTYGRTHSKLDIKGDVSGWTGKFDYTKAQNLQLTLSDKATDVKAHITKSDANGNLDLVVDNAGKTTTFNNTVNVTSFRTTDDSSVKLVGDMYTESFTLGSGASLTLAGGSLIVDSAIALSSLTVDYSKYSTDETHTLVTATDVEFWADVAGSYVSGDSVYSTSISLVEGDTIQLTYTREGDSSITTTVTGWKLNGTALTLNVDAYLCEGMAVNLKLLDEDVKNAILAELGQVEGDPMVSITLQGKNEDGIITADKLNEVVFVKGDTGQNYWGEMVGGQLMYNVERIPEPASATLSLAALMMLCARRRRRA